MRSPVLIVGSHRSGTSAVTRALRSLGLFLGEPEQCDHHDESLFFLNLHEGYLGKIGASWHQPAPFLEALATPAGRATCLQALAGATEGRLGGHKALMRRFAKPARWPGLFFGGEPWGWKDPRTSLFLPIWLEVFPEARVLHLVRHPLDVALSLQKREEIWRAENQPFAAYSRTSLEEWLELVEIYVEAASRCGARRFCETRFEDIQENPETKLRELADFCGIETSVDSIDTAAATIDANRKERWRELPRAEIERLLARFGAAKRLGYSDS